MEYSVTVHFKTPEKSEHFRGGEFTSKEEGDNLSDMAMDVVKSLHKSKDTKTTITEISFMRLDGEHNPSWNFDEVSTSELIEKGVKNARNS